MKDVATSTEIQRRDLFQFLNIRHFEKTQSFLYKDILQKNSSSRISWVTSIATRISWQIFCRDLCLQGGFNILRTCTPIDLSNFWLFLWQPMWETNNPKRSSKKKQLWSWVFVSVLLQEDGSLAVSKGATWLEVIMTDGHLQLAITKKKSSFGQIQNRNVVISSFGLMI